ncbi:CUB and zona pellucida-like domain-containing protein 1 isoform X1 [Channa argus]|uniref:CUB and zona pellucida-like domain-containing protein 1 isoform X1 n=1 Tax=Channa argus TaxID=215402 RepID=UPI0035205E40
MSWMIIFLFALFLKQKQEATVTCNQTTIMVEVKKDDLIRHNENNLHLNDLMDPACDLAARSNTTHLMAVMSLKTCGTKIEEDDDNIFFKNQITTSDTNETISRTNDVEIAFLCVYPKRANMTLGFTHKNPYSFSEKSFGTFNFQFEFFESQLFQNQIAASRYPVQFDLQQMIFMQIDASTFTPTLELFVESCRATPYDNPNSHISYSIIENGCVKDDTVQIYSSSPSQFKFGMEAFEFIGAYPEVYITCTVILCEAGVPGTRCSQGCTPSNSPGKREVAAQTSKHSISQGPLLLVKTSASKASGLSLNLGLNVLLIVGCLLICAVVIYRSRRFKANAFAIV